MAKYQVVESNGRYAIYNEDEAAFFSDFDFMGSAEWVKIPTEDCLMSKEDADEISRILEAADEPAEPSEPEPSQEDRQIESLQRSLDVARCRRNDAYDAYWNYQPKHKYDVGGRDEAYRTYERAQAYYEGFMAAVFAAGYNIQTKVGTEECTITK